MITRPDGVRISRVAIAKEQPMSNAILTHSLTASKRMLMRYTEDLKPAEYLHRPTPQANCVAWLLGHLALSDRRLLRNVCNVSDLPPLPDGFEKRFSRDEG